MINKYTQTRTLRSQTKQLLKVPAIKSKTLGNRSFYFIAPKIWNALPVNLRSSASINIFKNNLKTFLYECVFGECVCDGIFR